jgi:hypothetical protein
MSSDGTSPKAATSATTPRAQLLSLTSPRASISSSITSPRASSSSSSNSYHGNSSGDDEPSKRIVTVPLSTRSASRPPSRPPPPVPIDATPFISDTEPDGIDFDPSASTGSAVYDDDPDEYEDCDDDDDDDFDRLVIARRSSSSTLPDVKRKSSPGSASSFGRSNTLITARNASASSVGSSADDVSRYGTHLGDQQASIIHQ